MAMKCHVQTIWIPLPYLTGNHAECVWGYHSPAVHVTLWWLAIADI